MPERGDAFERARESAADDGRFAITHNLHKAIKGAQPHLQPRDPQVLVEVLRGIAYWRPSKWDGEAEPWIDAAHDFQKVARRALSEWEEADGR